MLPSLWQPCSILALAIAFGRFVQLQPAGEFRAENVYRRLARMAKEPKLLGREPCVLLPHGLEPLPPSSLAGAAVAWSHAEAEMRQRGLIR